MPTFDLPRIRRETSVRHLEFHETLDSTNKLARDFLAELLKSCPALVLTANQTAGRGRGNHSWWATPGSLTFSLVLDADEIGLPDERIAMLSLAAGAAVRQTLADSLPHHSVQIKWPNDIMVGGQKSAGILIEQHVCGDRKGVIVGIGINLNNSLASAPADVRHRATSVFDLTAENLDLSEVLIKVLNRLDGSVSVLREQPRELLAEINAFNFLQGRTVSVQTGDSRCNGVCREIAPDGAMILQTIRGTERLSGGTVVDWQ